MMGSMKRYLVLLSCAGCLLGAGLSDVHTVYLLPMSRGMDQYLANRLTAEHVLQVVTDPKQADVILTDQIGQAFEEKLADLLPAPQPAKPASAPAAKDSPNSASSSGSGLLADTANKLSDPRMSSNFGRARGMVFLVDPKSHRVLWSAYQPPKNTSPTQLEHTASDIVMRLKRDLNPKKQ
jgi:hypothetical protein